MPYDLTRTHIAHDLFLCLVSQLIIIYFIQDLSFILFAIIYAHVCSETLIYVYMWEASLLKFNCTCNWDFKTMIIISLYGQTYISRMEITIVKKLRALEFLNICSSFKSQTNSSNYIENYILWLYYSMLLPPNTFTVPGNLRLFWIAMNMI